MKRTLLLPMILLLTISAILRPQKAGAQITGITATGFPSAVSVSCALPATVSLGIEGYVMGTIPPGDSVTIYANFDDGFDTTFKLLDTVGIYTTIGHTYTLPGNYTMYCSITSASGPSGSWTAPIPLSISNSCANLQGRTYVDTNGDCMYETGEPAVPYVIVWLVNSAFGDTTIGTFTDDTGGYALNLPPDNYVLYTYVGPGCELAHSCPASGTFSLTATSSGSYTENYAYNCVPLTSFDMSASGYAENVVLGDSAFSMVIGASDLNWGYGGYTCTGLASTVTLTLDPHLHYLPAYSHLSMPPTSVSGSTLTWDLTTLSDHFTFGGTLKLYCDLTAPVGANLTSTLTATPTSLPDPNLTNNTAIFHSYVTVSFDPNGIEVSPQGVGTPGYIPNSTPLNYSIHFQNTGTAPAANITVNDTLDPGIDPTSFKLISSTAPVEIYAVGNAYKFRFSNINLPDSMTDPNNSIGNIEYSLNLKSGLAAGTQIKNKASIYFDYNRPVVTNSTLNTINNTLGVKSIASHSIAATVYPNPADNQVHARTADQTDFTMTMIDLLGRTVSASQSSSGNAAINTQAIAEGLYLVRINDLKGNELTTTVVVKH